MVKREHKLKRYLKTEKVLVSEKRYCDICNKEITEGHWEVTTGHYDWGHDSCESIQKKDVCSMNCLNDVMSEYAIDSNSEWNMMYINIIHCNYSGVKGDITYQEVEEVHG